MPRLAFMKVGGDCLTLEYNTVIEQILLFIVIVEYLAIGYLAKKEFRLPISTIEILLSFLVVLSSILVISLVYLLLDKKYKEMLGVKNKILIWFFIFSIVGTGIYLLAFL